ncbi:MAG: TMF family protein [Ignavibacteriales bacterium]|nr:TMF family protein [Ignavibacteriales bacterium]
MTQQELNKLLETTFTIPVEIRLNTFPNDTPYPQIANLQQTGFEISARELLHAIGSKTASLPANYQDECINSAYKFLHLLDFEGEHLGYKTIINIGSDLQTNTSNEIGIGFGCLIANKLFNVDWDTLEPILGHGMKFDYRATNPGQNYVYEFKGTKHRKKQNEQIGNGLDKKNEMHNRNESYDVELIVSAHLGYSNQEPRIILADPKFHGFENEFTEEAKIIYRLRHLARIAQYIGNSQLGRVLYMQSRKLLIKKDIAQVQEFGEKLLKHELRSRESQKMLERIITITVDNRNFIGRWVSYWQPKTKNFKGNDFRLPRFSKRGKVEIFQGASADIYKTMTETSLTALKEKLQYVQAKYKTNDDIEFTTFDDGTTMAFRII